MGRCYIATLWALAKCPYPYPSRISRVYCNLICFDKLIPSSATFSAVSRASSLHLREGAVAPQQVGHSRFQVCLYLDLLPPVSGWAQPWATCFVLLPKTARQILFSVCAMKWKTFGKHSFSQRRRMVVKTLIKHLLHRVEFHYGHLWLPGFIYTAGLITSPEK